MQISDISFLIVIEKQPIKKLYPIYIVHNCFDWMILEYQYQTRIPIYYEDKSGFSFMLFLTMMDLEKFLWIVLYWFCTRAVVYRISNKSNTTRRVSHVEHGFWWDSCCLIFVRSLLVLLAIVVHVLLRFTASDYAIVIYNLRSSVITYYEHYIITIT